MDTKNRTKHIRSKVVYTVLVAFLLSSVFLTMIYYVYKDAEADGFDNLHIQTKEIKEDIKLQMLSDRENLSTMARFASKLYSDGESYDLLLNSFQAIGLIENIGILLPDNTFMTKAGTIEASGKFSFEEEVKRGEYISGRVRDITNLDREIVRSAVPIISEGNTVAILYGVIELDTLRERYEPFARAQEAQLYVVERGTGNFIIDTWHEQLGNISSFDVEKNNNGFSYKQMNMDMTEGNAGYFSFLSQTSGEYFYIHYAPLEIGDWQIMLLKPERIVFSEARATGEYLFIMFSVMVLIMIAYLILIFTTERKESRMNVTASKIRNLLLEINQRAGSINEALENIALFAKSRSAFFVDTDGEDYNYIIPSLKDKLLTGAERKIFISVLLSHAGKNRSAAVTVTVVKLLVNTRLKKEAPELYAFLKKRGIKNISFAGITNKNNHISILGVINSKKYAGIRALLEDVAVCFSMAIYNKKYLDKTESIAATDSLTGLCNRLAYKKDVVVFDEKKPERFSCIYIDVNELHIINNKFGHAAGDGMLLFIANTLNEVFNGSYVYRIGGDEFLIFVENTDQEIVLSAIELLTEKVEAMDYHISIGMDYRAKNIDTESMVNEAEKRMYEAKAEYYQKKEQKSISEIGNRSVEHIVTGIRELDATLSIMSLRYLGIYCVSLKTDTARRILMPAYFNRFSEGEESYRKIFSRYIHEMVRSDYQRALHNFLEYDVLGRQLAGGNTPSITYAKNTGEYVTLSIYALPSVDNEAIETIWIFEKKNIDE